MPAMGDSVSEGTVLEWHKQEGDTVAADETLVEISTDKVDAEVPAPVAGTVVKIHAAEGDTVAVGALLAEIATDGNASRAERAGTPAAPVSGESPPASARGARRRRGDGGRGPRGRATARPARRSTSSPRPAASRSPRARSSSGRSRSATRSRTATRSSRSRPTRSTWSCPRRLGHDHRDPRRGGRDGHRRPGDRADDGAGARGGRKPRAGSRARARPRSRRGPRTAPRASAEPTRQRFAGRPPRRRRQGHRSEPRQRERPRRPDHQGRRPRGRATARRTAASSCPPGAAADQGQRRRARALHGPEPLDPDRDLVPHAHRHGPRRAPQAAQERRPEGLVHAPDRLRDRARRHRRDAGDGATTSPRPTASPTAYDDGAVNLGLAVDVEKKDGIRTLMVPVIRDAGRLPLQRSSSTPTTRSSRRRARTP